MNDLVAIVRRPAPTLADQCELTFLARTPIDFATLERQHAAYRDALVTAGARVIALDAMPSAPDSVFVEDAAVVLDEIAILTRPGTASREQEPDAIAPALPAQCSRERIVAPGCLEGGDVLRIGRTLYVGLTTRTNREGIEQLTRLVRPYGYDVAAVPVPGSLHLKTACTALDEDTVVIHGGWLDVAAFSEFQRIATADDEPFAANVLRIGDALIANAAFPHTLERVQAHAHATGQRVIAVDISEFGKAEAGLTCMSLVFDAAADDIGNDTTT
jgi:dimethylargininase